MDLKEEIISYFEKTPIPVELSPDKVSSFVKPKFAEKKPRPASTEETVAKASRASAPSAGKTAAVKISSETETLNDAAAFAEESGPKASDFIKVVFHHKLTGKEFLNILGNSKISNSAYQEIESNPGLTVKRLIEILDESPLTSEDYQRLIIATERAAELKKEAQSKIVSEPSKPAASPIVPPASSKSKLDLTKLTSPKTMEMPTAVSPKTNRIGDIPAELEEQMIREAQEAQESDKKTEKAAEKEKKSEEKEKKSKGVGLRFGVNRDDDEDEDYDDLDDDLDDDDDDDFDDKYGGRRRKRSNKGKIAVAAVAAAALLGISFGVRYYFTGSLLPIEKSDSEEVHLDEQGIFAALAPLSVQTISEFSEEQTYTVGGIGTQAVLKKVAAAEKRLLYIRENSIYIFELIGGQLRQLEVRKYNEGIKILGMIETDKGVAVITSYEGDTYSYSYASASENADEAGTTVNGTVKRPETVIELLDPSAPENRSLISITRLSGTLTDIYRDKNRIIAVTSENFADGAASGDPNTFMPYSISGTEKKLCSAENMLIMGKPSYSTVSAVFSVDLGNSAEIAGAAGGAVKATCLQNGILYMGHSNVLAEFDVTQAPVIKGSCTIDGSFEDFSAIGVFDGEIRATALLNGSASLTVLDGELKKSSEINNLGNGEVPVATCFNGKDTFVVTETGVCYGVDAENNVISESGLKVTDSKVYALNNAMGLRITPTDDGGKRTGIVVSTVKLDGTLAEIGSAVISSLTVAKNSLDEYLSSPAEKDIYTIGSQLNDDGSGIVAVPVVYFDGVSEVELFVIYSVNADGTLSVSGNVSDYDRRSKTVLAAVKNGYVIAVTDGRITTARAEDGSVVGYFDVTNNGIEYGY